MLISISVNTRPLNFYKDCTQFSRRDTDREDGLSNMIDTGREISFATFLKHVNKEEFRDIARQLGYNSKFKIEDDYAVRFCKGKLFGKPVYYMVQSAIEYIFM